MLNQLPDSVPYVARPRLTRVVLILLFLTGVATYIGVSDARKEKLRGDLSTFSLAASKVLFSGGDPYDRAQQRHTFKYLPTNAILLFPLTLVSVYAAQGIWFAFNLGLLIWAFMSLHAMLRPVKIPWWVTVLTAALVFRLMVMNLRLGQWNTSVFSLSIIGLRYLHEKRPIGSGLLGLSITLKYMPAVFLVFFLVQRKWKAFSLTVAAVLFWVFVVPLVTLGPTRTVDLLQSFRKGSVDRVQRMTSDDKIGSLSLNSTIYRALSPVMIEIKETRYYVNAFNLPRAQGGAIANVMCSILAIAFFVWLVQVLRRRNINTYGHLVLVGLCYLVWFLVMPGVRHAQLIGITPLSFCVFAGLAMATERADKLKIAAGAFILMLLYTIPSEIIDGSVYNQIAEASGIIAAGLFFHIILGIYLFYKLGLESQTSAEGIAPAELSLAR